MKILVVDREQDLKATLAVLAQSGGHEIQSATNGQEALDLVQGQQVDLLITEVILDPMNGFTLRNKMENRHLGVRTIFVSGWDLSSYAEHTAGYEIVRKPVTPEKLFPAIARALGFGGLRAAPAPAAVPVPPQWQPAAPETAPAPAVTPAATAAPAAYPMPAPVPVAKPAAAPIAMPRLAAVHAAVPKAVQAVPAAAPRATPAVVPKAGPAAAPRATPMPAARPAAIPAAAPRPAATPRPAAVAAAPDPMIGKTLGSYRIERRLGSGKWGPVYMAIQTSMNRPVSMELLSAEMATDETARQNFVATARAKAAVQHPHILSVYEADQAGGRYFYTHEYVDGHTLGQLGARGGTLGEPLALQTIKYVAQGLSHLHHQQIAHTLPDPAHIYVGADGLPYLANVAQPSGDIPSVQDEVRALATIIRSVLPGGQAQDRGLQAMLLRMGLGTAAGFQSWPALFQAIQVIEPKVIPADAFKLSAQDEAAIKAVEEARKRQKNQIILSIAAVVLLLAATGVVLWYNFMRPAVPDYSDMMVEIPAGRFIYQDGQTQILPTFYIDKYEVTMSEYEKFLEYLAAHGNPTTFDSPRQPAGLSHVPHDWNIYYGRASSAFAEYHTVKGVPITVECPVFNVSYFDAYAYAKWKGRRLPTEKEWEKAARGANGNIYPWGNDWDPKKLNSGADYQPNPPPGYVPSIDGYTWWAPVTAFPEDRSPFGVIGMAGNVSEWTDSWDAGNTNVVIRGGNFKSNQKTAQTTARILAPPLTFAETLGFRTASDEPPAK